MSSWGVLLLWLGTFSLATATEHLPPAPDCFYTVTPIRFGLLINIINATTGTYLIRVKEEGRPETSEKTEHQFSNESSEHSIKGLKPCTKYQHDVAFIYHPGREVRCSFSVSESTTLHMSCDDIQRGSCSPGSVCFQSGWDVSASLSTPNKTPSKRCADETCFKPDYEDICSVITTTVNNVGSCGKSSIQIDDKITIDFLNASEIHQTFTHGLPVKIEPSFPPNCRNLSVDYSCSEKGKVNATLNLSELDPFTNYTCTGRIKNNNVSINKTTTPLPVRIKCYFQAKITESKKTDTSVKLDWTTISPNCQPALPNLKRLSYDCSCSPVKSQKNSPKASDISVETDPQRPGGSCEITGLSPYTGYTCDIQIKYNDMVEGESSIQLRTKPGNNEKIAIGRWVFILLFCSVLPIVFACRIFVGKRKKLRNDGNDIQMQETEGVYENVPLS